METNLVKGVIRAEIVENSAYDAILGGKFVAPIKASVASDIVVSETEVLDTDNRKDSDIDEDNMSMTNIYFRRHSS